MRFVCEECGEKIYWSDLVKKWVHQRLTDHAAKRGEE